MKKRIFFVLILIVSLISASYFLVKKADLNSEFALGDRIDSLNGVVVYYNGGVDHVDGRNVSASGYNIGLKHQCVEFVKRYYYEFFHHEMPDSYGHAKSFFDKSLSDGQLNAARGLSQFSNPSTVKPQVSDLLVFDGSVLNSYGHVAIVSQVFDDKIEIIQQNPGPFASSRQMFSLKNEHEKWMIENNRILGWLRMK